MSENLTLRVHNRRAIRRALSRLELQHDELWDAETADIDEAIIWLAVDNPDLLKMKLAKIQKRGDSDE